MKDKRIVVALGQSSDLIVFLLDNLFQRLDIRHMGMRQIDL